MRIGIDIGASLAKIVEIEGSKRKFVTLPKGGICAAFQNMGQYASIYATGCGASFFAKTLGANVTLTDELSSFCTGARRLFLEQYGDTGTFILVSLGTGTSIFSISPQNAFRVAGTGVGGGLICGLGKLLLREDNFLRIVDMAFSGNRHAVDLMVSDIYPEASPVSRALTAANFGQPHLDKASRNDLASAAIHSVCETVGVMAIQAAKAHGAEQVVIAGSPASSPFIKMRLYEIGDAFGYKFRFLEHGAYCGALGAVLEGEHALSK